MSSILINANEVTKSTTSWWIKKPLVSRQHATLTRPIESLSFAKDFADLIRNISLPGYDKLLEPTFTLWEKLIWFSVHVTVMSALFVLLSVASQQYIAHHFEISLFDPLYPIHNVPFPAISICSSNRISSRAAQEYARELSITDPQKRNISYFLDQIQFLSFLYDKTDSSVILHKHYEGDDDWHRFQRHLDVYDTWDNETSFNTRRRMEMLSPKCDELIMKCSLGGKEINCFSKNAFQKSLTRYGFCCSFNTHDAYRRRLRNQNFAGSDYGLTVVLNTSHDDYFSEALNIDGTIVIVHDPNKYPDTFSGGNVEIFPMNQKESFISIRAQMLGAEDGLKSFHPNDRKCLFNDEVRAPNIELYGRYDFNNCITRCRLKSILVLCRCLPFYAPQEILANSSDIAFCSMQHKNCLDSYRFKWTNVLTQREPIIGLEREMEEALYCPQCIQSCEDIQFEIGLMSLPVNRYRSTRNCLLSTEHNHFKDISVLRIFFNEPHIQYFKRVVVNSWFETFSELWRSSNAFLFVRFELGRLTALTIAGTVGNLCGIVIGFSLVAFGEIALLVVKYFLVGIRQLIENHRRDDNSEKDKTKKNNQQNELFICP